MNIMVLDLGKLGDDVAAEADVLQRDLRQTIGTGPALDITLQFLLAEIAVLRVRVKRLEAVSSTG